MTHPNAPVSTEGRRRIVKRCRTRSIAHVAAEMGTSRATARQWHHEIIRAQHPDRQHG